MAAAEQAIQVVMQIAARGADRRQITKDDQQRLRERLPPWLRSWVSCSSSSIGAVSLPCTPAERIVAWRHGAVGSSCKMLAQPAGLDARRKGPRLQAAVQ